MAKIDFQNFKKWNSKKLCDNNLSVGIFGVSDSGKTRLVHDIISNNSSKNSFENIIFFCSRMDDSNDELNSSRNISLGNRFPNIIFVDFFGKYSRNCSGEKLEQEVAFLKTIEIIKMILARQKVFSEKLFSEKVFLEKKVDNSKLLLIFDGSIYSSKRLLKNRFFKKLMENDGQNIDIGNKNISSIFTAQQIQNLDSFLISQFDVMMVSNKNLITSLNRSRYTSFLNCNGKEIKEMISSIKSDPSSYNFLVKDHNCKSFDSFSYYNSSSSEKLRDKYLPTRSQDC
jgi:hypothetical protein